MGSFVFKWDHPAKEVFVTGTFDDWGKTERLEKVSDTLFEKEVKLPKIDEKIYYKFVVDNEWVTDHTAPQESDAGGITNNVLLPENITKHSGAAAAMAATISSVGAGATTAAMAGQVPKESERESSPVPGAFPETPANEMSVNPYPATSGAGNPVSAKSGDAIPPPTAFGDVNAAVTTDKASYENSGTSGAPVLPNVVTPEADRKDGGLFGLPDKVKNMIPESSLPIVGGLGSFAGNTTQSAGANATTAQLAGEQPIEPRGVPEVVEESQKEAGFPPEASANPEAVAEKSQVENELESKVPAEPATSESNTVAGRAQEYAAGAAAGATAAAAGIAAYFSGSKPSGDANGNAAAANGAANGHANGSAAAPAASETAGAGAAAGESHAAADVPEVVQESISEAHQAPEAAANSEAVQEKSAVESELLNKVKPEESAGEPAPVTSAATSATAPKAMMKSTEEPLKDGAAAAGTETETGAGGLAAATAAATAVPSSSGDAAPTAAEGGLSPASADSGSGSAPGRPGAMASALSEQKPRLESRDISPMTRPDGTHAVEHAPATPGTGKTQPSVTTGVGSSSTPEKSTGTGTGEASADQKKKNRRSFFGKIKDKLSHKDNK